MLSMVNGKTLLAEGQQTLMVFAEVSDDIVLVEGASIRWNVDCAAVHYSILQYNHQNTYSLQCPLGKYSRL